MIQPNLNYIEQLARGDDFIRQTLIQVIKDEFPDEKEEYFECLKTNNLENIASSVHRIKHKFSILGLEKSYNSAVILEEELRNNQSNQGLQEEFENTLAAITKYLKTI
jgi:HPt (histidine-containing phosphotransfer) domain-containing protein